MFSETIAMDEINFSCRLGYRPGYPNKHVIEFFAEHAPGVEVFMICRASWDVLVIHFRGELPETFVRDWDRGPTYRRLAD